VEKEAPMAKTERISLKPILKLVQRKKRKLAGARRFVSAADKKVIDARIKALNQIEALVTSACGTMSGIRTTQSAPPLSIVITKGH
jgi:hypothetical protein